MERTLRRAFTYFLFVTLTIGTTAHSQIPGASNYFSMPAFHRRGGEAALIAEPKSDPATTDLESDAVRLANQLLLERDELDVEGSSRKGGLYLGGYVTNALMRLEWIVGPENVKLLHLERDGLVTLNMRRLAGAARIEEFDRGEASRRLATYISANEGLLLLLQISRSSHRYLLYIGRRVPTEGGDLAVKSAVNLDNRFDSRINPLRPGRVKLSTERPPKGFDSLIAINSSTQWFNVQRQLMIPPGNLTFHELAEAHAKLELGLDYLSQGPYPGAHDVAIEREQRLMSQRPFSNNMVITKGTIRTLTVAVDTQPFRSRIRSR